MNRKVKNKNYTYLNEEELKQVYPSGVELSENEIEMATECPYCTAMM